jgi:hypothetical protein
MTVKELTRKEIVDELRKLGVKTKAELDAYLKEYEIYCVLNKCPQGTVVVNALQKSLALQRVD